MKTLSRRTITDKIQKGKSVKMPEIELDVPKAAPITMSTEGLSTRTFLRVCVCHDTLLKTFSQSVEMEVFIVDVVDDSSGSGHPRCWKDNFIGHGLSSKEEYSAPVVHPGNSIFSSIKLIEPPLRKDEGRAVLRFNETALTKAQCQSPSLYSNSINTSCSTWLLGAPIPSLHLQEKSIIANIEGATYEPLPEAQWFLDPAAGLNPLDVTQTMLS